MTAARDSGGVVPIRTSWTADELMRMDFPEPRWAVPGVVAEGVSLLVGAPKVGKSWLSLGLGLDIAAGRKALDALPVEAGPVLYLALEDTARRLQSRMRAMLAGQPGPAGLTLATSCPPLRDGGCDHVAGWLSRHPDARMVVIDVLAKVRGSAPAGMSAYEADYAIVNMVKQIADEYGVAIVLVHHARKDKGGPDGDFLAEVSGTHGLAGASDAVMVLKRTRGTADGILHITGRDVDEAEYALKFWPKTGAWQLLDGPASDHLVHDTSAAILRFLRDQPGTRPKEIASSTGADYELTKKTCRRLADRQQLAADPTGRYYLIDSAVLDVPEPNEETPQ